MVNASPAAVEGAISRLLDLGLIWESTSGLRPVSTVSELTPARSAGLLTLQPVSPEPLSAAQILTALAELSPAARALLEHVDQRGGVADPGSARYPIATADATTPAEELLARHLLLPRTGAVFLPGEVSIALRGGRSTTDPIDVEPEVLTSERAPALVERTAAGAAFETVRRLELLLDAWGLHPPRVLRTGGMAVRDVKSSAGLMHVDESTASLLIEVAHEALLISERADATGHLVWAPTDAFDTWTKQPPAQRWATLVQAWLNGTRLHFMVGTRDRGGKAHNTLAPELSSLHTVEGRRMALSVVAELEPGLVLAAGTGVASVVSRVRWRRPRRPTVRDDLVAATIEEAAHLGVLGLHAMPGYSRTLLMGGDPVPELAPLLPIPVDHLLIQADLTAVAPGPLESGIARRLQVIADVDSRGGATVYRFTATSVRRGLDLGWTTDELLAFLNEVSRTEVPQPLTYLVEDAARTYGTVRVGPAEAFVRATDDHVLTELLLHPAAAGLGLRRLAPSVLISTLPLDVLLPRLRAMGVAAALENQDGILAVVRPDLLRARTPKARVNLARDAARSEAALSKVVGAVRSGDQARESRPTGMPLSPADALTALRAAITVGRPTVIRYVDHQGHSTERVIRPIGVEGGTLTAHDQRADEVRTFTVHRITHVTPA